MIDYGATVDGAEDYYAFATDLPYQFQDLVISLARLLSNGVPMTFFKLTPWGHRHRSYTWKTISQQSC